LLAWNIFFPPPLTPVQMEDRKAIIVEYLKTL
jgi:hypothetical protein